MKIVDAYPPNILQIASVFPGARRKGVIFTYGNNIYAPFGVRVSASLRKHEEIHAEQQKECGGPETWWRRYLDDTTFRFAQELEAHRAEYNWFRTYRPQHRRRALKQIAQRLSSDVYGELVTQDEATALIQNSRAPPASIFSGGAL